MLEIKNVGLNYDDLKVINNLSLQVNEHEIVVLIGPSGCGKSSILNMIAHILKPTSGQINTSNEKIGFVFQDDRLLPWKNLYQNIAIVNEKSDHQKIAQLISEVDLTGFEDYYPNQLSGGMKKRIGIARAFYYDSDLLLMDEPFSGLDFCLRAEMIKMLKRVWQNTKPSVLFVTHELDEALEIAHRIIVLSNRPASVVKEIVLPPYDQRKELVNELNQVREEIISLIT